MEQRWSYRDGAKPGTFKICEWNTDDVIVVGLTEEQAQTLCHYHNLTVMPDLLVCAQALLERLGNITTAQFATGGEKAEREALQAAVDKALGKG